MIDEMDDNLLLAAFHNGVSSDLFIHKLYDQEPQTMSELVHSSQNFMNAEDAIIAKKRKRVERMEANLPRHPEQGPRPKKAQTGEKKDKDNRKVRSSSRRSQHYMPLNAPLEKMKGDPNKRNKNKYYRFHIDHRNDMNKCYDLKQQIKNLIK